MVSPFMKLSYKLMLAYIVAMAFCVFVFYVYKNLLLYIVLWLLISIIAVVSCHYLMDKLERKELSKYFDKCSKEAVREGMQPENAKMLKDNKEKILDLIQKL